MKKGSVEEAKAQVKKIEAFKTTDGQVFEDSGKAEKHQVAVDRRTKIEEFVEKHFWSGDYSKSDIADLLLEYGKEIGI